MNFKEFKLIDNIVANEFNHVQNEAFEHMDELNEYKKIAYEIEKMQHKLLELLPKEYHDLVDDLDSKVWEMASIEIRHYFKKGVVAGTSNLNFIRDITKGIQFY